jgi:hypothetical protein
VLESGVRKESGVKKMESGVKKLESKKESGVESGLLCILCDIPGRIGLKEGSKEVE